MKKSIAIALLASSLIITGGCSNFSIPSMGISNSSSSSQQKLRFTATGYGTASTFEGYTAGQRRLMTMRAAKLDAYRALAEQIYGVRVKGNTTVAAMVAQNDSFRVYLDAVLRGARVVSVTPMAEGSYETEVEIELPADFWRTPVAQPAISAATASPTLSTSPPSTVQSSAQSSPSTAASTSPSPSATATAPVQLANNVPTYNRSFYYAD